ncbi:hypothetical protein [Frankia sp. AgW1.1]|uniref:hypothetical protein n=1 Tax=Frankia sp. AgW1.1 TaxID=1836971 RepID=UPI0019318E2E|nr:hypothetical protein [Frankia sp. AgW1.1]MBL7487040.1 hypothetical protein [Frankia sp. AgW1.1]
MSDPTTPLVVPVCCDACGKQMHGDRVAPHIRRHSDDWCMGADSPDGPPPPPAPNLPLLMNRPGL